MQSQGWGMRRTPINPFQPIFRDMSLFSAWELLAKTQAHRVAILSRENELAGIMTESMCISMIRQNMTRFECLKKMTVSDILTDLNSKVISVKESATALEGFRTLAEHNVGGIAVLDDDEYVHAELGSKCMS